MLTFGSRSLRIGLDSAGRLRSLYDLKHHKEYCAAGEPAPLLSLVVNGREIAATAAAYDEKRGRLQLSYGGGVNAIVRVATRPTHLTFELDSIAGASPTRINWGPVPTTIGETIGATVGVVRGGSCFVACCEATLLRGLTTLRSSEASSLRSTSRSPACYSAKRRTASLRSTSRRAK